MVLTMLQDIWRELWTLRVQYETTYGYASTYFMVVKYLWFVLQDHLCMEEFLLDQFRHNLEVLLHNTLYLFEHQGPRDEFQDLRKKVEVQINLVARLN